MKRRKPKIMTMKCRRGCGKMLTTTTGPISASLADWRRYHGICEGCLTESEQADMRGPMLMRTAKRIAGGR